MRQEITTVWCVIEEHNGRAVDSQVFANQQDAHQYANEINSKARDGYPFPDKWAVVHRNKIRQHGRRATTERSVKGVGVQPKTNAPHTKG